MMGGTQERRPQAARANIQFSDEFLNQKGRIIRKEGAGEQQPNGTIVLNL